MPRRIVVVGGGIVGLCTAAALVKRGIAPIVLERKRVAGAHGSSHGPSRITRSVYADPAYVYLMQRLHAEHWPAMERMLGKQLLFKTPGLFFGHGRLWEKYLTAVLSQEADVERVDVDEGRRRFPQFRLASADSVLHDHTTAVIAADRVLCGLRDWLVERGAVIQEDTALLQLEPRPDSVSLLTTGGRIDADAVVLCAGSWLGGLIPNLKANLTVLRQTIGYFDIGHGAFTRPPHFPVWVRVGDDVENVYYGLPEFETPGVKVGRHRTVGASDDPNADDDPQLALADLDAFVRQEFRAAGLTQLSFERCLYTVTASEDFLLGRHPEEPRIAIGSACSGHGFKFGPWVGQVLADLALDGGCDDPDFLREQERFSPARWWEAAL